MSVWNEKANNIFFEATEIVQPGAREQFLRERCGDDKELRRLVDSLLAAEIPAADFFAHRTDLLQPARCSKLETNQLSDSRAGEVIGPYKLLERIGDGGFGVVYLAEQQQPVRRRVALKLIKLGMDTREVIARFEAERQALAMMDHPHIAKVLDAGATVDGRPYFAMEYVKGTPITEYCDKRNLTLDQRLDLFSTVCHALQHAHQKGVIHRDIKPSNIMVSADGERPIPKIIDFGIAKAISQKLTEKTLFTRLGQIVGTPQYMSPEQTDSDAVDVDTRSDIYSLGVVLYELLTGTAPLEDDRLHVTGWNEMMRLIREDHTPKPSDRLSRVGEELALVARKRGSNSQALCKSLRGELDWIVMKALDKDRHRRYESASNFAADIQRYLSNAPIEARPPSTRYLVEKFVRRNRSLVAAASLVLIATLAGLAGTTVAWLDAGHARRREAVQRSIAENEADRAGQERDRANANAQELRRHLYTSLLARAEIAIRDGKLTHARELVAQCPEQLRGWEWKHLQLRSKPRELLSLPGHNTPNLTPDGSEIVGVAHGPKYDKRAVVAWDAKTGEARTIVKSDAKLLRSVLSHDGKYVAYSDYDGNLTLCEFASGLTVWTTSAHGPGHLLGRFSRDGLRLAIGIERQIRVLNAQDGSLLSRIERSVPGDFALSSDGQYVASGVRVWDANTGNLVLKLDDDDAQFKKFNKIAFSNDGRLIAGSSLTGRITIWDAANGQKIRDLLGHTSWVSALSFGPDDNILASAGADTTVRLWDVDSGQQLSTIGNHEGLIYSISFSRDGSQLVSSSGGRVFRLWNTTTADVLTLQGHHDNVCGAHYIPNSNRIVTADRDGVVRIWDATTGQIQQTLFADSAGANVVALHPNGKWLATANSDGDVQLRDLSTGELSQSYVGHQASSYHMIFTPSGDELLSAGRDEKLLAWNTMSGELLWELPVGRNPFNQIAVSPDSKWLASVAKENHRGIHIWDARTGRLEKTLPRSRAGVSSLEFAYTRSPDGIPDGLRLAAGYHDATIQLWNPLTGELNGTMRGRSLGILDLAFSPDGQRIFSSDMNWNIAVWNPWTGDELTTIRAHDNPFRLSVSPDGKTVVTASADGSARLWESESPTAETDQARRTVATAARLVDELFRQYTFQAEVLEAIASGDFKNPRLRTTAIEIAKARGDNAYRLDRESRAIVLQPAKESADYQLALRMARVATKVAPDSLACRTTLGIALFRLGKHSSALDILQQTEEDYSRTRNTRRAKSDARDHILRTAYLAMTLHELNQSPDCYELLTLLRSNKQQNNWVNEDIHRAIREASRLMGNED